MIKRDKLKNLTLSITDGEHGTVPNEVGSNYYLLSNKNIVNGEIVYSNKDRQISEYSLTKIRSRTNLQKNDVLLSTVGSIGKSAIISDGDLNYEFQRSVGIIKCDPTRLDFKYLRYFFDVPYMQEQLINRSNASVQRCIYISDMEDLDIDYFEDRSYQSKIGNYFWNLDKKINNNYKIKDTIYAYLNLLYEYWFIQYDFPNESGHPYKSSGGKLVYNDQLDKEIPISWSVEELKTLIKNINTGLNPRSHFKLGEGENFYVTIKNIENGRVVLDEKCDKISDKSLKIINNRSNLEEGDILFTSIEPVGKTYLIQNKPTNWDINESVFSIKPNSDKLTSEYLYLLLSHKHMKIYSKNLSGGSIHSGIRHNELLTYKTAYSGLDLIYKFSEEVSPYLKRLDLINQEINFLNKKKQYLLPRIMNGQITLS